MSQKNDNAPQRNPTHAFRSVGDEGGLVVVARESEVRVLNPVGALVYSLLDGHHSRQQIVEAIVKEFDVSQDQAGEDYDAFVEDLASRNMLATAGDKDG